MTPGSTSLLCLSCHDGSFGTNAYGNEFQLNISEGGGIGTPAVIGKDNSLENHHPIGFNYDAVQAVDTEIRSADAAQLGGAGSVRDHLDGANMECDTCHSPHNTENTGESLLWRSDRNSQLCLTCHDKGRDPVAMMP